MTMTMIPPGTTVNFHANSSGTVATIFYEWRDFPHLGANGPDHDVFGDAMKTYICNPQAVTKAMCSESDLGNFIVDGAGKTIRKQRVDLRTNTEAQTLVSTTAPTHPTPHNRPRAHPPNFHSQTYRVNQTGYYCVGASENGRKR